MQRDSRLLLLMKFIVLRNGKVSLMLIIQWNVHKTGTIGEQPFGRYREVVFLGRF